MSEPEAFLEWAEATRDGHQRLVEEVRYALDSALEVTTIEVAQILGRVKSLDSIREKISRKSYEDPRAEVPDLAGVRVVCLYQPDVDAVSAIVDRLFTVMQTENKREGLGPDRMGYQGIHKIVKLNSSFQGPRYRNLGDLVCEIQIRTIVQDAWAAISHNVAYKAEESTPPAIQRSINNVAALLEIAQEVFDSVRERSQQYRAEIQQKQATPEQFLAQPINLDTLIEYARWKFPEFPPSERVTQLLMRDLDHACYKSLADIDSVVERAQPAVEKMTKVRPKVFKFGTDRITKSLGFVDDEFRDKHPFAQTTRQLLVRYSGLVSKQ